MYIVFFFLFFFMQAVSAVVGSGIFLVLLLVFSYACTCFLCKPGGEIWGPQRYHRVLWCCAESQRV
jgi:hypothetical protein